MSNKEKLHQLAETLSDANLAPIVNFATVYLKMLDDALDDAFCEALLQDYKNDPNKGDLVSMEDAMKELGLS